MIFDKASWRRICRRFLVKDCTFGFDEGRLGFLLVEEGDPNFRDFVWESKFVAVKLDLPFDKRFFVLRGSNLSTASMSSAWAPDQSEFIAADTFRNVWSYKPKTYKGGEEPIPCHLDDEVHNTIVTKVVRVGTTVYALGGAFRIYQRIPGQQWRELTDLPVPPPIEVRDDTDSVRTPVLWDLAGFSNTDMYAVGTWGAVWHFDGERWRQIDFPVKVDLHTVACGDNGEVFVTDRSASLWKRTAAGWTLLCQRDEVLHFSDSAWFQGRLWCAGYHGLCVLEGDALVYAALAQSVQVPSGAGSSHSIDVSPDGGQMLICDHYGAWLHDGTQWTVLFDGEPAS